MKDGKALLDLVISAHGGLERWNELNKIKVHAMIGGLTWQFKGQQGVLSDVFYQAQLHKQYANYFPFLDLDHSSTFEPGRVVIETSKGEVIEELLNPRTSFEGHTRETKCSNCN